MKFGKKLIAIVIILVILFAGFVYFFDFFKEEKKPQAAESDIIQIDDRIAPYSNQGLTVEIKRIRNRGILDVMLQMGSGWKNPPTFFWIVSVDGKEHNSAEICSAGGVEGDGSFTMWDNFGHETKGNYYAEEGQETSKVVITILEKVKTGLYKKIRSIPENLTVTKLKRIAFQERWKAWFIDPKDW